MGEEKRMTDRDQIIQLYDFSDKVIIPFNTHEGSGESGTNSAIVGIGQITHRIAI